MKWHLCCRIDKNYDVYSLEPDKVPNVGIMRDAPNTPLKNDIINSLRWDILKDVYQELNKLRNKADIDDSDLTLAIDKLVEVD